MVWVRSAYAGELAVLSAWIAALVPWTVSYQGSAPLGSAVLFLRFGVFGAQLRWPGSVKMGDQTFSAAPALAAEYSGFHVVGDLFVTTPVGAVGHYNETLRLASLAWGVGAAFLVAALALSLVYYAREDTTESWFAGRAVGPVRLMGALLAGTGLSFAVSTYFFAVSRARTGVPIPVGLLVILALAGVLLLVERTEETADAATDSSTNPAE